MHARRGKLCSRVRSLRNFQNASLAQRPGWTKVALQRLRHPLQEGWTEIRSERRSAAFAAYNAERRETQAGGAALLGDPVRDETPETQPSAGARHECALGELHDVAIVLAGLPQELGFPAAAAIACGSHLADGILLIR